MAVPLKPAVKMWINGIAIPDKDMGSTAGVQTPPISGKQTAAKRQILQPGLPFMVMTWENIRLSTYQFFSGMIDESRGDLWLESFAAFMPRTRESYQGYANHRLWAGARMNLIMLNNNSNAVRANTRYDNQPYHGEILFMGGAVMMIDHIGGSQP